MKSRRALWIPLLASVVALAAGYWVGRARAAGVPAATALVYSGFVTDGTGSPATGSKSIVLQVFDAETAGTMKCSIGPVAVDLGPGGFFQMTLPEACTTAVHQLPDLWIEAFVGADSLGRIKLNAVPYALEAGSASAAGGALKTSIEGLSGDVAALKAALTAAQSDITALKARVDLKVFYKGGDNGTVSCDTYCVGSNWAGGVGTCVSAQLASGPIACATNPGAVVAGGLGCWCSHP